MAEFDGGHVKTILGRMRAFQQSLPDTWSAFPARYADEYVRMVEDLQRAGVGAAHLTLPAGAITQREVQTNYLTGDRALLPPQIDRTVLMSAVGGAIAFIEDILEHDKRPAPAAARFGPVTITNSNVNLGTIHGDMRAAIQVMESRGQEQLARLLADLVAQIAASQMSAPEKDDAAQLAGTLAREVAAQPAGKLSAAVRPVASALGSILTRSAELAQIWQALQPFLTT